MILKVNGIVIKEYTVGESDKFITLFTKELGKIQVGAPKAKKFDRGLSSGTALFVYGEFIISGNRNNYKLLNVEVRHMFHHLGNDLLAFSYASYIAEFVSEVSEEGAESDKLLTLALYTLHNLGKKDAPFKLIRCIFEVRAMTLLGFMLNLHYCMICETPITQETPEGYVLNVEEGGILCKDCKEIRGSIPIRLATWYALNFMMHMPVKELFNFNVEAPILKELIEVTRTYVPYYIEKEFKSLAFIKSIEIL